MTPNKGMKISDGCLSLIESSEGFRSHLYNDPNNHNCTIGWGHLVHEGPIDGRAEEEPFKDGITPDQGRALLKGDAAWAEIYVSQVVKIPLSQGQFDGLVDFTFNEGAGRLHSSTLLKVVNASQFGRVRSELMKWTKAGGAVLAGLVARRTKEADLFEGRS